jgi:DNA-binding CsgD family transcriptional regulator
MIQFSTKIFDGLSSDELRGLLGILHHANEVETQGDVEHVFRLIRHTFRFPYVLGGIIMSADVDPQNFPGWEASDTRHRVVNISYPSGWVEEYSQKGYYRDDLVMHSLLKGHFAHTWTELYAQCENSDQRAVFDSARQHGLQNGLSVGRLDPESKWGSFVSCASGADGDDVRLKHVLDYVVHRIHEALVAFMRSVRSNEGRRITERERDVIRWVAEGKTQGEIATNLGVSERTLKSYVLCLFRKMDVTKHSGLVAEASRPRLAPSRTNLTSMSWFPAIAAMSIRDWNRLRDHALTHDIEFGTTDADCFDAQCLDHIQVLTIMAGETGAARVGHVRVIYAPNRADGKWGENVTQQGKDCPLPPEVCQQLAQLAGQECVIVHVLDGQAVMEEDEHVALFSIAEATQFFRSFFTKVLNRPL